jgi:hypothetical protein
MSGMIAFGAIGDSWAFNLKGLLADSQSPAVSRSTMNIILRSSLILLFLFSVSYLYVSCDKSPSECDKLMLEDPFLKITEKVIVFLKNNPSKNNLDLNGLLKENVISKDDYEFLLKHNIKYNPPSSAGPHDNYLSIFDRENENGTSSHILYDLVDKSDPSITKSGTISDLNNFVSEWFDYASKEKSLSLFKGEKFYYFTLCYWDNDYWDKQHIMLLSFSESDNEDIKKFKSLMNAYGIQYKENNYQDSLSLTVLLPSKLSVIEKLSNDILKKIFLVSQKDVINFTPDGFRFKIAREVN